MPTVVEVTLPAGKSTCKYGQAFIGVDEVGKTDVPAYVAKSLVDAGATCPGLAAGTAADLLATAEAAETIYLLMAYGKQLDPASDALAVANGLMAARGEPAVVFG